jgi:uncharacterized protein (UPF0264 family)
MTRLLVSVRNATEALAALDGGAAWIDVKEPARGALGAADAATIADVVRIVADRCPVSAALGELDSHTCELVRQIPHGVSLVKVGLAGCGVGYRERQADQRDWREAWADVAAVLPTGVALAAVVYADWQIAGAPPPSDVLAAALSIGCSTLLIDTFDKRGPALFNCWPVGELAEFTSEVRRAGLRLVVAGSLTLNTLELALQLAPDLVAVRGAACRAGREGEVDTVRVRELVDAIARHAAISR